MDVSFPVNKQSIRLPKINQLGIVVHSIPDAVHYYTMLLGIGPWFRSGTVEHTTLYKGKYHIH
jgi:hypothetical protein